MSHRTPPLHFSRCRRALVPLCLSLAIAGPVPAVTHITGGSASAIDASGAPVPPLISSSTVNGIETHTFETGEFATGPFISTLEFSFTLSGAEPLFVLHFSDFATILDPTGIGGSIFSDSFAASMTIGGTSQVLMVADDDGPVPDPFGTVSFPVALGPPLGSGATGTSLIADLGSLSAGTTIDLFLDITNVDDGRQASISAGNIFTASANFPEPSSSLLCLLGAATLISRRTRK